MEGDGGACGESDSGTSHNILKDEEYDREIILRAIEDRRLQGLRIAEDMNRFYEGMALLILASRFCTRNCKGLPPYMITYSRGALMENFWLEINEGPCGNR
jgi:hypothetical protein